MPARGALGGLVQISSRYGRLEETFALDHRHRSSPERTSTSTQLPIASRLFTLLLLLTWSCLIQPALSCFSTSYTVMTSVANVSSLSLRSVLPVVRSSSVGHAEFVINCQRNRRNSVDSPYRRALRPYIGVGTYLYSTAAPILCLCNIPSTLPHLEA